MATERKKPAKKMTNCESCEFFDYDEEAECEVCTLDLDEDEQIDFMNGHSSACPYYRYYDEYTSVRKQN